MEMAVDARTKTAPTAMPAMMPVDNGAGWGAVVITGAAVLGCGFATSSASSETEVFVLVIRRLSDNVMFVMVVESAMT